VFSIGGAGGSVGGTDASGRQRLGDDTSNDGWGKTAPHEIAPEPVPRDLELEVAQRRRALAGEPSRQLGLVQTRFGERLLDRRLGKVAVDALPEEFGAERATPFRTETKSVPHVRESEGTVIQIAEFAAAPQGRRRGGRSVAGTEQPALQFAFTPRTE